MPSFKDNRERTWEINVTVAACKRVKNMLGADLLDVDTTPKRLISDPIFLADVLYCVCKPDADIRSVTDEAFGAALYGDPIGEARAGLLKGIEDFFPSPEERKAAEVAIQKAKEFQALLREKAVKEMEAENMEDLADAVVRKTKEATAQAIAAMFGEESTD